MWQLESLFDLYLSGLIVKSQSKEKQMHLIIGKNDMYEKNACRDELAKSRSSPCVVRFLHIDIEAASRPSCEPASARIVDGSLL